MALPEKNEVTADLETQAMVSEEELNYSKQEEDEKENEDADQEMNCEDDNDDVSAQVPVVPSQRTIGYLASVEKSQKLENLRKKKEKKGEVVEEKTWDYKQRPTEEEIHLKRFENKGLSKKNL
ncbi:hypothetical protein cypCar_00029434 [Cyprinus carpio]|nr:hypothetical protein cypCar_00029434 [Cyprinus carpio]